MTMFTEGPRSPTSYPKYSCYNISDMAILVLVGLRELTQNTGHPLVYLGFGGRESVKESDLILRAGPQIDSQDLRDIRVRDISLSKLDQIIQKILLLDKKKYSQNTNIKIRKNILNNPPVICSIPVSGSVQGWSTA